MSVAKLAMVVGAGLLVFGLSGYREGPLGGAGWNDQSKIAMGIGAMLVVGGWLYKKD